MKFEDVGGQKLIVLKCASMRRNLNNFESDFSRDHLTSFRTSLSLPQYIFNFLSLLCPSFVMLPLHINCSFPPKPRFERRICTPAVLKVFHNVRPDRVFTMRVLEKSADVLNFFRALFFFVAKKFCLNECANVFAMFRWYSLYLSLYNFCCV